MPSCLPRVGASGDSARWLTFSGVKRQTVPTYTITWSRAAKRAIQQDLPEYAAVACLEFILGPLADNPWRVGKPLQGVLEGLHAARRGEFRVIYRIQEDQVVVYVATIRHRRDAYA